MNFVYIVIQHSSFRVVFRTLDAYVSRVEIQGLNSIENSSVHVTDRSSTAYQLQVMLTLDCGRKRARIVGCESSTRLTGNDGPHSAIATSVNFCSPLFTCLRWSVSATLGSDSSVNHLMLRRDQGHALRKDEDY